MSPKRLLILLVVLNMTVLLGQLWPAGASLQPYARAANVVFLAISLGWFLAALRASAD